ncbi:uncharacterized protein LOC130052287 isoform X2 [Ostrea edulis]|uniref:uncharacterized protein LOC130052287 isoform X2 n=1 Tax=Ostrea edulis TaxID=37623 RepID=UPI0024AFEEBA|nr:uncharacterized protein LOC130052287 isoform X2 [Ostrea edulis]
MAIVKTFLCFSNTRVGTLICGCYTLINSLVCLVFYLFRYVGYQLIEDSQEYKGIVYAGFVLYGLMIAASLVLIPGVQLTLNAWEIVWMFFYCFKLIANCYCFACVVSQYQELSEGRGTYEYLYKPRNRRSLGRAREFDIDTFELPFGIHLPPYTETDPCKELNPPLYDHLYPQPKLEDRRSINLRQIGLCHNIQTANQHSDGFHYNPQYSGNMPDRYSVTVDVVWI